MKPTVTVSTGKLVWSGEHWVRMLRRDGADRASAIVSHYSLRYSPGGSGNVAVVRIDADEPLHCVCTDNRECTRFAVERFFRRVDYFDAALPVMDATFERRGDIRRDPGWSIRTADRNIVTRWTVTEPPIIAHGSFRAGQDTFTLLFFTDHASARLDDRETEGRPFPRDIWRDSIGGDRSSCVFALAETFIEMRSDP